MSDRLVAHANTFHPFDFEEALRGVAAAGFANVELSAVPGWTPHINYASDDPDRVRERVAEHGLTAVALSGHSDLTTPDGVRYAVEGIEWAAAYGLRLFTTAIGGHASADEDLERFLKGFAPVVEAAERLDVTVGLEVHGSLMASGALARPIVERIGSRRVGVKYDTGNCEYYGGVNAVSDFPVVADLVVNVDMKDHIGGVGVWNFPPPGEGAVDWGSLSQIFSSVGYAGPLTVEIEFVDETWPAYDQVVEALRTARRTLTHYFGTGNR
jgi:sugar phosphate isomerase/epimerase